MVNKKGKIISYIKNTIKLYFGHYDRRIIETAELPVQGRIEVEVPRRLLPEPGANIFRRQRPTWEKAAWVEVSCSIGVSRMRPGDTLLSVSLRKSGFIFRTILDPDTYTKANAKKLK